MRGTFVLRDGKLVPKHLAAPLTELNRSSLPSPMLIRDGMDSTWNPVNGQHYDSKRAYEKAVRAAGCEIVGNEKLKASPRPELPDPVHDVVQAIAQTEAKTTERKKHGRRTR